MIGKPFALLQCYSYVLLLFNILNINSIIRSASEMADAFKVTSETRNFGIDSETRNSEIN